MERTDQIFRVIRKKLTLWWPKTHKMSSNLCCPDDKVKTTEAINFKVGMQVYYDYGKN